MWPIDFLYSCGSQHTQPCLSFHGAQVWLDIFTFIVITFHLWAKNSLGGPVGIRPLSRVKYHTCLACIVPVCLFGCFHFITYLRMHDAFLRFSEQRREQRSRSYDEYGDAPKAAMPEILSFFSLLVLLVFSRSFVLNCLASRTFDTRVHCKLG